ncbi:MAG: hypothetical protein K2Y37_10535 [Pirellulales bacterium]|nr:hypothetical protein [Pirellulales bacterium]
MQAARQQRYVLVVCRVCRTRMHPPAEWIGRTIHCPDCGTAATVPEPELARPQPLQPDPGEYALGGNWSAEPTGSPPSDAAAANSSSGERHASPRDEAADLVLVKCSLCGTRMHFPRRDVGRKAKCPDCGTVNAIVPRPDQPRSRDAKPRDAKAGTKATAAPPESRATVYDVGSATAPPPAPTSFVAPRSIVERIEVPEPPRWTFFSGVFGFPWSRGMVARWAGISLGLLVVGCIAAILLGMVGANGLGRETVLATGAWGLLIFFALLWSLSYASGLMLVIVRETAEGADTLDESPDIDWRNWIFPLVYLLEISAQAVALGWGVRWLLKLGFSDWPAGAIGLGVTTFLTLPVLLLSALESGSALLPFSGPILRSLARLSWAWLLFYGLTAALMTPIAGALALAITPYYWWGCLAAGPLVAAYLLLYARLLGRLGWLVTERLQPVSPDGVGN